MFASIRPAPFSRARLYDDTDKDAGEAQRSARRGRGCASAPGAGACVIFRAASRAGAHASTEGKCWRFYPAPGPGACVIFRAASRAGAHATTEGKCWRRTSIAIAIGSTEGPRRLTRGRWSEADRRTDKAIAWFEKARSALPGVPSFHSRLAAAYALRDETERAAAELAEARRLNGHAYSSLAHLEAVGTWGVPKIRALFETTYFAGLRKAGMPEE